MGCYVATRSGQKASFVVSPCWPRERRAEPARPVEAAEASMQASEYGEMKVARYSATDGVGDSEARVCVCACVCCSSTRQRGRHVTSLGSRYIFAGHARRTQTV